MNLQSLIDAMIKVEQNSRSRYHLTLGHLRDVLCDASGEWPVEFDDGCPVGELMSYRGYYSDLAFDNAVGNRTVADVYPQVIAAVGAKFTGYKGGEFLMDEGTPLWRSECGAVAGVAVVGVTKLDGKIVLVTKQVG